MLCSGDCRRERERKLPLGPAWAAPAAAAARWRPQHVPPPCLASPTAAPHGCPPSHRGALAASESLAGSGPCCSSRCAGGAQISPTRRRHASSCSTGKGQHLTSCGGEVDPISASLRSARAERRQAARELCGAGSQGSRRARQCAHVPPSRGRSVSPGTRSGAAPPERAGFVPHASQDHAYMHIYAYMRIYAPPCSAAAEDAEGAGAAAAAATGRLCQGWPSRLGGR